MSHEVRACSSSGGSGQALAAAVESHGGKNAAAAATFALALLVADPYSELEEEGSRREEAPVSAKVPLALLPPVPPAPPLSRAPRELPLLPPALAPPPAAAAAALFEEEAVPILSMCRHRLERHKRKIERG